MNNLESVLTQVLALGIKHTREKNPALSAFTFAPDTQGQQVVYGGSVIVRVPVLKEAVNFDPTVGLVDQDTNYVAYPVTINQAIQVNFNLNLGEAQSDTKLQQLIADAAIVVSQSLGDGIVNRLLAASNDPTYFPLQKEITVGNGDYDKVVELSEILDDQKLFGDRTLVANSKMYGELLLDDRVIQSNTNSGTTSLRNGVLTDIAGFSVAKSTGIKGLANLRGIATDKSALALVSMIPVDLQSAFNLPKVADTGIYTEPETGVSMYWQAWFDPKAVKARISALLFFGIGKMRPEGLVRIVETGGDVTELP